MKTGFKLPACILALLLSCLAAPAQEKCGIIGYVHEFIEVFGEEQSVAVGDYEAVLITAEDTLRVVSHNGDFQFRDLDPGTVRLLVVKDGYLPFDDNITLTQGDQAVTIELTHEGEELSGAVATAVQPVLTMKGDTLVFHADAVKRMTGDYAIDLIAQMPGAEVSDMGITIHGKQVSRAYVNGVLVFGRDPMDAMRHLAAEQVVTMNIYDEAPLGTDEDLVEAPQKERVIDIHTKDPIFDVTDLQAMLSGGADKEKNIDGKLQERYIAGLSGNFFSENLQVKADLLANNVGLGQSISMGGSSFSTPASALTSQTVRNYARVSVEKYWGRNYNTRTGLSVGYTYSDSYTRSPQKSIVEQFKTELSPARTISDSTSSVSRIRSHSLNTGFQKSLGESLRMNWLNNLSLHQSLGTSDVVRENNVEGEVYKENSSSRTDEDGWSINESLSFTGWSGKSKSRNPYSINLKFSADKGNTSGFNVDTLRSSASRRYLEMSGDKLNWNAGAAFDYSLLFKNGKHQERLNFALSSEYAKNNKKQASFDLLGGDPVADMVNTYDYTYSALTSKAGLTFSRLYFSAGLSVQHSYLTDTERIPADGSLSKSYISLIPYIYLYSGKGTDLSLSSSVQLPSLEQIRKRVDNTNPYLVVAGNPDLRPGHTYNLSFTTGSFFSLNPRNLNINVIFTDHPIVSRERVFQSSTVLPEYDGYEMPAGSMLRYYDNADWALNAKLRYSDGTGIDFSEKMKPIIFSYDLGATAAVNPSYLMDELYRTTDLSGSAGISLNYTPTEKLRLSLSAGAAYTRSSSSISDAVIQALNWNYGTTLRYTPWNFAFLEARYNNSSRLILGSDNVWGNDFLKVSLGGSLLDGKLSIVHHVLHRELLHPELQARVRTICPPDPEIPLQLHSGQELQKHHQQRQRTAPGILGRGGGGRDKIHQRICIPAAAWLSTSGSARSPPPRTAAPPCRSSAVSESAATLSSAGTSPAAAPPKSGTGRRPLRAPPARPSAR